MGQAYTGLFDASTVCVKWLDKHNLPTREELGLRVMKVMEESGEAAQPWIGFTGQNPRKGITHTKSDVIGELADVIITATVAIQSLGADPRTVIEGVSRKIVDRINGMELNG